MEKSMLFGYNITREVGSVPRTDHVVFGPRDYYVWFRKDYERIERLKREGKQNEVKKEKRLLQEKQAEMTKENVPRYMEYVFTHRCVYTIQGLSETLDLQPQYIQRMLIKEMESLYITNPCKADIRSQVDGFKKELDNSDQENRKKQIEENPILYYLLSQMDLSKRVWFTEKSVIEMIQKTFFREDELGNRFELKDNDVKRILKGDAKSPRRLKAAWGVRHDIQFYRKLESLRYHKYTIPTPEKESGGKRHGIARYYIFQ